MLCCVPNCNTNTISTNHYARCCFKFPTNKALREEWQRRISLKKFGTKNSGVCMLHFEDRYLKQSSVNPLKARLVAGAVPTLCLLAESTNEPADRTNGSEYVNIEMEANRIDSFDTLRSGLESVLQLDNWKVVCTDTDLHIYNLKIESNGNLRIETSINIDNHLVLKIFHQDKAIGMKFSKQTIHKSIKLKGWSHLQKLLDRFNNMEELKIHLEKICYE